MLIKLSYFLQSVLLTGALMTTAIAPPRPSLTTAIQIAQDCVAFGGIYHTLAAGHWICLYPTPDQTGALGLYCNVVQTCDRLMETRRPDHTASPLWEPMVPTERIDDGTMTE